MPLKFLGYREFGAWDGPANDELRAAKFYLDQGTEA